MYACLIPEEIGGHSPPYERVAIAILSRQTSGFPEIRRAELLECPDLQFIPAPLRRPTIPHEDLSP